MSDELFNVIFRGDILPGFNLVDVKARFGQLFKMDAAKTETFFTGRPVVLKANCDRATGDKFKAVLAQAGAVVEVKSATAAAAAPRPVTPAASAPASTPAPAAASAISASAPVAPVAAPAASVDPWSVAPVGNLVRLDEIVQPVPVSVDISHINVVKRNPFATEDESPLEEARAVTAPALDLSGFSLGQAGESLVPYEEFVPRELDLSELSLDALGADVLREDEREVVVPVKVDISAIDLAPPGGELGEIPRPAAPPPPSTDHLSVQK